MPQTEWYHVSSHGAVLFAIAANQGCTTEDLAAGTLLFPRCPGAGVPATRSHREGRPLAVSEEGPS